MMIAFTQLFIPLLLIAVGESFSLRKIVSPISAANNKNEIALIQLHARKNDHGDPGPGHPSRRVLRTGPGRGPQNKRTALRWVVQGVERCLAKPGSGKDSKEGKTYSRLIDASLVDALFQMVDASCQRDVLDAEKRIQVLMKNPKEFPMEVNERVIKATAMVGLASLSLSLLKDLLRVKSDELPSSVAYTSVLNVLRKTGRLDRMDNILADLASTCRRISQKPGIKVGVDIIAFNTYLAALCDAAVNELPFTSAVTDIESDGMAFNFTSLSNSSSITSSSEKYLYKALNLLKGDIACKKFALEKDPDAYSYNSILNAAAKCSKADANDHFTKSIQLSCLRIMKERGIKPDILTYNARIQATLTSEGEEAAIQLIDQILSDSTVKPDRYTINFILKPFINAGRRDEIWSLLRDFHMKNAGSNNKIVFSAFEAFLSTIVNTGEIEFAREIFEAFFLPHQKQKKRMQLSQMMVMKEDNQQLKEEDVTSTDARKRRPGMSYPRGPIAPRSHLTPRTRHFNILLGGYTKVYQSALSKIGRSYTLPSNSDDLPEDGKNVANITMPDIEKAYELLDIMLDIGVPLDSFSVSSLMALPSTPEKITALLIRIEPEMMVELNPAAYRSIITAYGKAGDASSACWMFEEMTQIHQNQGRNIESWNTLLGALSKGCVGDNGDDALDILGSNAARARRNLQSQAKSGAPKNQFISLISGVTCIDASTSVLDSMRNRIVIPQGNRAPRPNSQSYCLVTSAVSESGSSETSKKGLDLFRKAMSEGVSADGRFLNAVLRCFGDDIEGALAAWKSDVGPAAAAYEQVSSSKNTKQGTNLIAAYNGLMHVCGRAIRPDVATRIVYAMTKAKAEPTEVTLNSYFAGKRLELGETDDGRNMGLRNQYESLLAVECTKYSSKDKRQANDRKIRIIF